MREVSSCQLFSQEPNGLALSAAVLELWIADKFDETASIPTIRRSGKDATLIREHDTVGDRVRKIYQIEEEVGGGSLRTQVTLLGSPKGVSILCLQGMVSSSISPPTAQFALPRFVGTLIQELGDCRAGKSSDRLFRQVFRVNDRAVEEFAELVFSSDRLLPLVAISELDGRPLTRSFPDQLAERLAGVAHVCQLSSDASWRLTGQLGRAWSCYNGGVKLYWPGARNEGSAYFHPLWTYDRISQHSSSDVDGAKFVTGELITKILDASTYRSVEREFRDFDRDLRRRSIETEIEAARTGDDFKVLAELYEDDNHKLQERLDDALEDIDRLKRRLTATYNSTSFSNEEPAEEELSPPTTVEEAVNGAKSAFHDKLAFPDALQKQISTLSTTAGPPEKIFRYLSTLNDYAQAVVSGATLGNTIEKWLEERGVICTSESYTIDNNKKAQKRRTWMVDGHPVTCDLHLKPNDGTSPDCCVRIYFAPVDNGRVRIGYIGRHF